MKTIDAGYPEWVVHMGGFPDEYPLGRPFGEHIEYVKDLLLDIDNEHSEAEFVHRMKRYYKLGFKTYADACCKAYSTRVI